jgi:hypothetical protein
MANLTQTQIITAGMGRAGNLSSAVRTRVEIEFQAWLNRQYQGWAWPFLKKRSAGLSLSAGATSLTIGNGNGGVTNKITKLVSPIILYKSNKTTRTKCPIVQSSGDMSLTYDETLADSATFRGTPTIAKARHGTTNGSWDLVFLPFPDVALLVAVDYYELPATLTSGLVPVYPEDSTMISAVEAITLQDQKGVASPEATTAWDAVVSMIARDRSTHGAAAGENDVLQLDSSVFR